MTPQKILEIAPRRVRIGGFDWKVEWGDGPLRFEQNSTMIDCWGLCHRDKHLIQISIHERPSGRHVISTFVHELLHAIYYDRRIPADADEEATVVNLEHGLTDLLVNNPEVLDFIRKGIK